MDSFSELRKPILKIFDVLKSCEFELFQKYKIGLLQSVFHCSNFIEIWDFVCV